MDGREHEYHREIRVQHNEKKERVHRRRLPSGCRGAVTELHPREDAVEDRRGGDEREEEDKKSVVAGTDAHAEDVAVVVEPDDTSAALTTVGGCRVAPDVTHTTVPKTLAVLRDLFVPLSSKVHTNSEATLGKHTFPAVQRRDH